MKRQRISLIILILWTLVIFGYSLMPGSISSNQSGTVTDVIEPVVNVVYPNLARQTLDLLVRKAAHITEFFVLGIFLYFFYSNFIKTKYIFIVIAIHGFITASIDETIQLFVKNRSGRFTDVLIDMIGITLSIIITYFISFIINKYIEREVINTIDI